MLCTLHILTLSLSLAWVCTAQDLVINAEESSTVQLPCEISSQTSELQYWIRNKYFLLPNGKYNPYKYYFDVSNNSTLGIKELESADAGKYTCVVIESGMLKASAVWLDVKQNVTVHRASLWEDEYKHNLVRGIVAAFIFAAAFGVSCAVYKYRWRSDKKKLGKENKDIEERPPSIRVLNGGGSSKDGMANPAFQMDSKDTSAASSKETVAEIPAIENDTHM